MTVTRRQAREWAVQMLCAADLNPPEDIEAFVASTWHIVETQEEEGIGGHGISRMRRFAEERVRGVLNNLREIDDILAPLLDNWDLYRLGTVERAVLRVGIWEIRFSDVPAPVAINEAVDITNWFSASKSRTIVNGVLDKYAKTHPEALSRGNDAKQS